MGLGSAVHFQTHAMQAHVRTACVRARESHGQCQENATSEAPRAPHTNKAMLYQRFAVACVTYTHTRMLFCVGATLSKGSGVCEKKSRRATEPCRVGETPRTPHCVTLASSWSVFSLRNKEPFLFRGVVGWRPRPRQCYSVGRRGAEPLGTPVGSFFADPGVANFLFAAYTPLKVTLGWHSVAAAPTLCTMLPSHPPWRLT